MINRPRQSLFVNDDDDQSTGFQNGKYILFLPPSQEFPRGRNTNVTSVKSRSAHEEQGSNHFGIPHGHGSNGAMRTSDAMSGSTTYHHVREDIGFTGQDNNIAVLNRRRGNVNHQDGSVSTRSVESIRLN